MATHSIIPAWKIPWIEEPGGLQYIGSQGVELDWAAEGVYVYAWVYSTHSSRISDSDG